MLLLLLDGSWYAEFRICDLVARFIGSEYHKAGFQYQSRLFFMIFFPERITHNTTTNKKE